MTAPSIVFDSSAALAYLMQETGWETVSDWLEKPCCICAVNHTEVITKLFDRGMQPKHIADAVLTLQIQTISFDEKLATQAAWLRAETKKQGLSLGDRACLALALDLNIPVLTSDRIWSELRIPNLKVKCIR